MKMRLWIVVLLCSMSIVYAHAKRVPPKPVAPVIAQGIRYAAEGDGTNSYNVATNETSGNVLWRKKVFHTQVHWWRGEEDNQWLFISDLKLAGNSLLVRDEKNRCYLISLKTHDVNKHGCGDAFSQQIPRH